MKKIVLIILFSFNSAFAHPHLFIESKANFIFTKDHLEGIQVTWIFDEMFSTSMIQDYDENKNGKYDKREINIIKNEAFSNLVNYNYFTYIKINNKKFKIRKVINFNTKIKNKQITYSFFIPLNIKKSSKKKIINFSSHDKSYYAAINYPKKNPLRITGIPNSKFKYKIVDNTKNKFYDGLLAPKEIHLKFWK